MDKQTSIQGNTKQQLKGKKKKLLIHTTMWMTLTILMLIERIHIRKATNCMVPLIWHSGDGNQTCGCLGLEERDCLERGIRELCDGSDGGDGNSLQLYYDQNS